MIRLDILQYIVFYRHPPIGVKMLQRIGVPDTLTIWLTMKSINCFSAIQFVVRASIS